MKVTVYHNSRCSKCRETMTILKEHGIEPTVVEYLENPPTRELLEELLQKLNMTAHELARSGEDIYKQQNASELSENELIDLMVKEPILIERPIVVMGDTAIVNRPPEKIKQYLNHAKN